MTRGITKSSMAAALKCGVASTAMLLVAGTAFAQAQPESDKDKIDGASIPDIVVTGTLIRGIAPAGTNVIGVTQEAVQATGATTTAQLLQSIPQLGQFNTLQQPAGAFNTVTGNRPNLRNLPGFNTAGSSPTLVLVDGHRVVGVGIQSTSPDPDIIPPAIIERVEIVPDGGSAIYGSDAVAGVLNFITKKNFNGVQLDSHYGFADNYYSLDASVTLGKSWEGGSAYIAYNYSEHDDIYGRDRDYVRTPQVRTGGVLVQSLRCSPGNVLVGSNLYALPYTSGTQRAGTANSCDESDNVAIYPREHRHSVFAGLTQQLNDAISVDIRTYFTERKVATNLGPNVNSTLLAPFSIPGLLITSPYYGSHVTTANPFSPLELQTVSYAFGPDQQQRLSTSTWGIAPTVTADIGAGFQLRALASYGESTTENHVGQLNTNAVNAAVSSGAFNPYDPASSSAIGLTALRNYETFGKVRQQLFNARLVIDGSLFTLPGGAVKLAAGVEYNEESFKSQKGTLVPGTENTGFGGYYYTSGNTTTTLVAPYGALPLARVGRNTKSAFGELVVPIFSDENGFAGMRQLTVSASGRYDKYSDFGDTFNPKFGLTYKPVEWIKVRGAWGKSFAAPSLADNSVVDIANLRKVNDAAGNLGFIFPPAALVASGMYPAVPAGNRNVALMFGTKPGIQPQKATTWSVGADISPPIVPGLRLSVTYWNIDFRNLIQVPSFTSPNFYAQFGSLIYVNPTQAIIDSFVNQANLVDGEPSSCTQPSNCYAILDTRKQNLGNFKLDGLDFAVSYFRETGFGSVDFNVNANYELSRKAQPVQGQPYVDQLRGIGGRIKSSTTLGANVGNLRSQLTWNYTGGYDLLIPVGLEQQTRVKGFHVFNLFFKYDVPGESKILKDLSFTLNVNNVLDQDPPYYALQAFNVAQMGYTNGNTVGRFVQFGVSKKF
ncbi:TonB-dependent receptor [Sphingobium sufflavum]|uniref:TonB-dependent receptor domain-containing protein n=1 Tax=Sphingobium sufflavum TaxID=1129547 RepID=UPI001F1B93DB|nr:TonB-dependent receptor [Sphingobium sufflavum]MCE7796501.1 TonB-dependent receptor [Sphingobium sufflavum]